MDDTLAIRTDSLSKSFGDVKALDGITLEVRKGAHRRHGTDVG
jgi:ABC-type sugar transport system ATPase subunit